MLQQWSVTPLPHSVHGLLPFVDRSSVKYEPQVLASEKGENRESAVEEEFKTHRLCSCDGDFTSERHIYI